MPSKKPGIGLKNPHPSLDVLPGQPSISSCDKAKDKATEAAPWLHSWNCRIKLQQFLQKYHSA